MKHTKSLNKRKLIAIIISIILLLLLVLDIFIANYLVGFALGRSSTRGLDVMPEYETSDEDQSTVDRNIKSMREESDKWAAGIDKEILTVTSDDGLSLKADLFPSDNTDHKWVIAVHGYTSNRTSMYTIARNYYERGYNVLTPDLRTHGESEGDYIGMGWLDRKDMLLWISQITTRDPDARIVLHGISMGGATV